MADFCRSVTARPNMLQVRARGFAPLIEILVKSLKSTLLHEKTDGCVPPYGFACQRIPAGDRHAETCHPIEHIASDFCLGLLIG